MKQRDTVLCCPTVPTGLCVTGRRRWSPYQTNPRSGLQAIGQYVRSVGGQKYEGAQIVTQVLYTCSCEKWLADLHPTFRE